MPPLFFGFPEDERAWTWTTSSSSAPTCWWAPVSESGARSRRVYLPAGARWLDPATGLVHDGGTTLDADAPLARIPVFVREGADVVGRLG